MVPKCSIVIFDPKVWNKNISLTASALTWLWAVRRSNLNIFRRGFSSFWFLLETWKWEFCKFKIVVALRQDKTIHLFFHWTWVYILPEDLGGEAEPWPLLIRGEGERLSFPTGLKDVGGRCFRGGVVDVLFRVFLGERKPEELLPEDEAERERLLQTKGNFF